MQAKNTEWMVAAARRFNAATPGNPFIAAVCESIEVGVVVPSILKAKLEAAGFSVIADDEDHKRHGFRPLPNNYRVHVVGPANVHPDHTGESRTLIAAGVAPDEADALLHAALGFLRECQHAEDRAAGRPKRVFGLGSPAELGIKG